MEPAILCGGFAPAGSSTRWMVVLLLCALLLPPELHLIETLQAATDERQIDWAKEQQFWSFLPPVRQSRPTVKDNRWPRQSVDIFVLSLLETKGLAPTRQGDRRTLIRRLNFDLTGLPPSPDDVSAFLSDRRDDAYERLADRLLVSPRFGERMASLWLPLARYAEDQAHQVGDDTKFFYPNAYKYREWVIEAFNRDLPYDEFLRLQLAADQIDGTNSVHLAALGFLGLGPKYYNRNRIEVMADEWEDRVDTVTRTTLGLTVACARCHDHKFEPITMRDYYALAGVFASTKMINKSKEGREEKAEKSEKMDPNALHVVEDGETQNLNVFLRGDASRKGPVVERRFLRVLSPADEVFLQGSGRKELAEMIAVRGNPLTARVMVNRVWGLLLGTPLVATPSNFGHSGQPPTNQRLLDDLAVRFMENGWSVKTLVRGIVLSSTYQQASGPDPKKAAIDPGNELFWRMNRRRLSIEQWRDAVLFASGQLDLAGGRSMELDNPTNVQRTVYARISRLKLNDLLMQFDYPDANVHAEKRGVTTTATQKLFMLNSPFMLEQARALAARLTANPNERDTVRVKHAYQILFSREPTRAELKTGLDFLRRPEAPEMSRWEQYAQALLASNEMIYVD